MDDRLAIKGKPRTGEGEIRPFACVQAKHIAVKSDHLVEVGGADIDVIEGCDGHEVA